MPKPLWSRKGYANSYAEVSDMGAGNSVILLKPQRNLLDEVVIEASVSRNIVAQAIRNIRKNYEVKPTLMTGF